MPLFTKTESELETHQDKWLYFLKNLTSFDDIPAILREPVFERAFAKAEVARMDDLEYQRYYADRMAYLTNNAAFHTAQFEGVEIGRAEGRAEGEIQKAIEIARNMKIEGLDPTLIAKITGLSPDEIERLG
jgi:predicted transposase/invertase (TIGR01784 family)